MEYLNSVEAVVHHSHEVPSDDSWLRVHTGVPGTHQQLFALSEFKRLNRQLPKHPAP